MRHGFNKSSNSYHLTPTSLCKALSKLYQNNAINYGNVLGVDSKHWYFILKVDEFLWKIHKKDGKSQHDFAHSTTTCGHSIYDPLISGRKYQQSEIIDDKICGPDIWKLLMTSCICTCISWDIHLIKTKQNDLFCQ